MKKQHIALLLEILEAHYPDAGCSLVFQNAYELLVATILSAQCTDKRVNAIMPGFIQKFPTPQAVLAADISEIQEQIRSAGFYHTKARHIYGSCQKIVSDYFGQVPGEIDKLLTLPGVGRKTANVVRGVWFRLPALVVDTHMIRVTRRLGLTGQQSPEKIEQDLMRLLPASHWVKFGHQIIAHGRKICLARKPQCENCPLSGICATALRAVKK